MIEKEIKKVRFKSEDGLELVGIWHLPHQNESYQSQAKKNKKVILIIPHGKQGGIIRMGILRGNPLSGASGFNTP